MISSSLRFAGATYRVDSRSSTKKKTAQLLEMGRRWFALGLTFLGHSDFRCEINVLNRIEELHAFRHWALKRFAPAD